MAGFAPGHALDPGADPPQPPPAATCGELVPV